MALNSLIPVMTEGFGMGQAVSTLLLPTAKHVNTVICTLSHKHTQSHVSIPSEDSDINFLKTYLNPDPKLNPSLHLEK